MSAPKFKVGDRVRRTASSFAQAVNGGVYEVSSVSASGYGIDLKGHHPSGYTYDARGFELAGPNAEYTFRQKGQIGTPAKTFPSRDEALEYIRTRCDADKEFELLEVRAVAVVVPKRIVEVNE